MQLAIDKGAPREELRHAVRNWNRDSVTVIAPARVDLGGGWSDTPPFCLDWGGTVLNIAVELNGAYPIRTMVHRLVKPVVRCISGEECTEFRNHEELAALAQPGSPMLISQCALRLLGILNPDEALSTALANYGGGIEIRTEVNLPMGSGLGTSSILAATTLRALGEMVGLVLSEHQLVEQVMMLEQLMTTGGGWQDQVRGIYPGAKLVTSAPGIPQHLRVTPVYSHPGFHERFLLYHTGITRVAKNLLREIVGRYLARETMVVQILHGIKTLACEMTQALQSGDWGCLGSLMDHHWRLNQILDPHTTTPLIDGLLSELRPHLAGAKLAGAGGGGFLMLLAKSPEDANALRSALARRDGKLYSWQYAEHGLRMINEQIQPKASHSS